VFLHEDLRIGSEDGAEYAFAMVDDLVRDRAGNYYILERLDNSVWKYDAPGRYQGKIGRRGMGPGEFSMPFALGLVGDDLCVSDLAFNRFTVIRKNGELSVITRRADLTPYTFVANRLLKDGSVFSKPALGSYEEASGRIASVPLLRIPDGGRPDTIALMSLAHRQWLVRNPRRPAGQGYLTQPFADNALFAVSPDGDEIVVLERRADARGAPMTISKYRYDGRRLFSVAVAFSPQPIPKRARELAVRKVAEPVSKRALGFASVDDAARALEKTLYVPDHLPPATQVIVGLDGRIWVRREETGETWSSGGYSIRGAHLSGNSWRRWG
jgi:hypothetical protein